MVATAAGRGDEGGGGRLLLTMTVVDDGGTGGDVCGGASGNAFVAPR